ADDVGTFHKIGTMSAHAPALRLQRRSGRAGVPLAALKIASILCAPSAGRPKMFKWMSAFALAASICAPALADEMEYRRRAYYPYRYYLPPEQHVIEVVQPPYSGNFIINGTRFTARTPACFSWAAGERIRLLAGDWNGRCVAARFYNFYRRNTCDMWCGGGGWWRGSGVWGARPLSFTGSFRAAPADRRGGGH